MKHLKILLLSTISFIGLSSVSAQTTPTVKVRGNDSFQLVDNYLIALKRLGIPTGTTDNLEAVVAAPNTAKIMYRTDLSKLRVYNPVTHLWGDAVPVDFSNYYSKSDVNLLLDGYIKASPLSPQNANIVLTNTNSITARALNLRDWGTIEGRDEGTNSSGLLIEAANNLKLRSPGNILFTTHSGKYTFGKADDFYGLSLFVDAFGETFKNGISSYTQLQFRAENGDTQLNPFDFVAVQPSAGTSPGNYPFFRVRRSGSDDFLRINGYDGNMTVLDKIYDNSGKRFLKEGEGNVLTAPNGNKFSLTVSNTGELSVTPVQ